MDWCNIDVVQDLFIKELKGYKPAPVVSLIFNGEKRVLERHVNQLSTGCC